MLINIEFKMKFFLSILFIHLTFVGFSQKEDLANLFFNIPMYESRDSIYAFCIRNQQFKEKSNGYITTRNRDTINTYFGTVQNVNAYFKDYNIDSAKLQVSTGGQKSEGDSAVIFIIPITSYYHFNKKYSAKKFYSQVAKQLTNFTNTRRSNGKFYLNDKFIGYSKIWIKPTNNISDLQVSFEKDSESKKYSVTIECILYEYTANTK